MISLLQDTAAMAREAAIISLRNMAEESSIPHLIEALGDEDAMVRKAALEALRHLTKQSFGFREEMPAADERNKQAGEKWRAWWSRKEGQTEGQKGEEMP